MKVLVFPFNSLILSDMVLRRGHEPLTSMKCIANKVKSGVEIPPFNVTDEDLKKVLTMVPIDIPAGAKGRVALMLPLISEAEAAIIMEDLENCFGPSGCARANMILLSLLARRGIPILKVKAPRNVDEARKLIEEVDKFLGRPKDISSLRLQRVASQTVVLKAYPSQETPTYPQVLPKVAVLGCGLEYSGVFCEVLKAIMDVGAEPYIPEYSKELVKKVDEVFGIKLVSGDLKALLAQTLSLEDLKVSIKGVVIMTCFRCGEGAFVRSLAKAFIIDKLKVPVVSYAFTEMTRAHNLRLRVEALCNIVLRRRLYRKPSRGLALGLDVGSTSTKAVVCNGLEVLGHSWTPSIDLKTDVEKVVEGSLKMAGVSVKQLDAIAVTGYGRLKASEIFPQAFVIDDVNSSALGAVLLSGYDNCLVLDIGGTDNKAIEVRNLRPVSFSLGGICAGASGKFLEVTALRLGVSIDEFGEMALKGLASGRTVLNAYCALFGLRDAVALLAKGVDKHEVAAAVCRSIAEQVLQQLLSEVRLVNPIVHVGGTSLVKGLSEALREVTGLNVVVPKYSQFAGAVGAAAMALNARDTYWKGF
ncbi:MAG: DUF2112 family protein [Candidatus Nezhaarchaeales archaeon]